MLKKDSNLEFDVREDGTPFSPNFDDVYFSSENGLAETEYVFLRGNGLPQAWERRERTLLLLKRALVPD